jgi:hypothetical protein
MPSMKAHAAAFALVILGAGCQERGTSETSAAPPPRMSEGDLVALCTAGTVPTAKAAVAEAGKPSPAVLLSRASGQSFRRASLWPQLAIEQKAPDAVGWEGSAEQAVFAVCADITETKKTPLKCWYNNDKGEQKSRDMTGMTVKLRVLEVATGKVVAEDSVAVPPPSYCFMRHSDISGSAEEYTRDLGPLFVMALAKLQPKEAPVPKLDVADTWLACEGRPVPGAPPAGTAANHYAAFERKIDGGYWKPTSAVIGEHSFEQLVDRGDLPPIVFCRAATRGKKVRECKYDGGKILAVHAATWQVKLVAAATGKVLAEKTFDEKGDDGYCPFSWKFDDDGATYDTIASPSGVDELARPVLTPK